VLSPLHTAEAAGVGVPANQLAGWTVKEQFAQLAPLFAS
jgi:hypothetical protein